MLNLNLKWSYEVLSKSFNFTILFISKNKLKKKYAFFVFIDEFWKFFSLTNASFTVKFPYQNFSDVKVGCHLLMLDIMFSFCFYFWLRLFHHLRKPNSICGDLFMIYYCG